MCGIAGIISNELSEIKLALNSQANSILHRGPDDMGTLVYKNMGLAHRRLAIIDLSPNGAQPMESSCSRYVIAFNGEIYNWNDLKDELEINGYRKFWRGHSDTEILLESISAWGLKETLLKLRGMFAIALLDKKKKCIFLARDRIGQKPLYYGNSSKCLFFGSELKAITAIPGINLSINSEALSLMLRHGYVPAPYSIYQDVYKLKPGHLVQLNSDGTITDSYQWWNFNEGLINTTLDQSSFYSEESAIDSLEEVLELAIKEQMIADVPLGALLSGGLDSSLVVALMQKVSSKPIKTFTIGFAESNYNEANYAKDIANHFHTDHTELSVSPNDALNIIPSLPDIYDEPFADSSQIPTALVCSLTKNYVTVCLSGDAGDELFGGYNRYFWTDRIWQKIRFLPYPLKKTISKFITLFPVTQWDVALKTIMSALPSKLQFSNPGDKIYKFSEILDSSSQEKLYYNLVSQWRGSLPLVKYEEPDLFDSYFNALPRLKNFSEAMMAVDTVSYLPDDILVKVDRAAMATSLETRIPFLDERVIEFSQNLPYELKVQKGQGKWIIKELLRKHIPDHLINRPKQGFGVPIDSWLRGPLREWAEDLLSEASLSQDNFLDPVAIRGMWESHLLGRNVHHALWNVLMYQAWRQKWA